MVRTHAVILWSLVGACIVLLGMIMLYVLVASNISVGVPMVGAPKHTAPEAPSLFGTVTGIAGTSITIDSKQPFSTILTDDMTTISALGGAPLDLTQIHIGAVLTATGVDNGGGSMTANAIVVISNPGTASAVIGAPPEQAAPTEPTDVAAAIGADAKALTSPFTLARNDGTKSSQITPSDTSTWWLSADGKTLLDVEISSKGVRTQTKYDMTTRHIVQ